MKRIVTIVCSVLVLCSCSGEIHDPPMGLDLPEPTARARTGQPTAGAQPSGVPHFLGRRLTMSGDPVTLPADCPLVGEADGDSCKLSGDFTGPVEIFGDNVVLDCDAHSIVIGGDPGPYGAAITILPGSDDAYIRNCRVSGNWVRGILSLSNSGMTVAGVEIDGPLVGIQPVETVIPTIVFATIIGAQFGVLSQNTTGGRFVWNEVDVEPGGEGLLLLDGTHETVVAYNDLVGGWAGIRMFGGSANYVGHNSIEGTQVGIYVQGQAYEVIGNQSGAGIFGETWESEFALNSVFIPLDLALPELSTGIHLGPAGSGTITSGQDNVVVGNLIGGPGLITPLFWSHPLGEPLRGTSAGNRIEEAMYGVVIENPDPEQFYFPYQTFVVPPMIGSMIDSDGSFDASNTYWGDHCDNGTLEIHEHTGWNCGLDCYDTVWLKETGLYDRLQNKTGVPFLEVGTGIDVGDSYRNDYRFECADRECELRHWYIGLNEIEYVRGSYIQVNVTNEEDRVISLNDIKSEFYNVMHSPTPVQINYAIHDYSVKVQSAGGSCPVVLADE